MKLPVSAIAILLLVSTARADQSMILKPNMDVLKCAMPQANYRMAGSNAPGQIFLPGEPVHVKLVFEKGADKGNVDFAVEIQEITTRDPQRKAEGAFTDTAGQAPLIGLEGKPALQVFKVAFDDKPKAEVEVRNLPVAAKFGTYALVLVRGNVRQFLGTVCRVPAPRAGGNLENTPILGEFGIFDRPEVYMARAEASRRMGVHGMRLETSWAEREDGTYEWDRLDKVFAAVEAGQIQLMVTLGGHGGWMWPFKNKQTPAVVKPGWDGNPYWGQCDWVCDPKLYSRYGRWITALCQRYWKDGRGGLWGLENYNEPWEGGGISGWARDLLEYRKIQRLIAESARKVDPRIKICAASSIMNTETKFYSDGSRDMDPYIDVFTDHYVVPSMCYGPLVAKAHGKLSMETETWFVNAEYLLPHIVQFLAAGQKRLVPWHPRVLFDQVPGTEDRYFAPTPLVAATAALNAFLTGKEFEKLVFHDHLPWVFQFGKDADREGVLVVFGQLMSIGGDSVKERLWAQVEGSPGGTMTVDNADGLLRFFDLAGNPQHVGQAKVVLPMSIFPTYIMSDKGPAAAAARVKQARIEGKRPVEIVPRDFSTRLDAKGAALVVTVHNCLNRAIAGRLQAEAPPEVQLEAGDREVKLDAGQRLEVRFPLRTAKANAAGAYSFKFAFRSDAGNADWAEVVNTAIATKGTKQIDGNLDDWRDTPGVTIVGRGQKAEATELLRRPWLDLRNQPPDGGFAEFKMAWDEKYLYVAARVFDKTPQTDGARIAGRDENAFFHTAASDKLSPYKEFLKDYPGRSFGEVPYVYCRNPEQSIHFRRDRLHIALDASDDWHDLAPDTDKVPFGFHAVPDTDYEYAAYLCSDGKGELWRLLAPGVPRKHDFPREPRGPRSTGPVPGAVFAVKLDGNVYTYEMALPREELAQLKLQPGTTFGLALRAGNQQGPHVDYATDKAATKLNGLTLHPYWERSPDCGVRWTLVE